MGHSCPQRSKQSRKIHSSTHSSALACIHSLIHSYIHSFIHPSIHSFIHSFIHSYIHSFIHSLIHSFIHFFSKNLSTEAFNLTTLPGMTSVFWFTWRFLHCTFERGRQSTLNFTLRKLPLRQAPTITHAIAY